MSILLQVGIGLLPATIVTTILLFKRKLIKTIKLLPTLILFVGCITALICGGVSFISDRIEYKNSHLSRGEMLELANALLLENSYAAVNEVLEQYSEEYGYDDECRLLTARIALCEGNYDNATMLYAYLSEKTDLVLKGDREVSLATAMLKNNSSDIAMMEYVKSIDRPLEDYGYSEKEYNNLKQSISMKDNDAAACIKEAVLKQYDISEMAAKLAKIVSEVNAAYSQLRYDDTDTNDNAMYAQYFDELEQNNPAYFNVDYVNKARIKAYTLAGNFRAITQRLNNNSRYHEVMISAELYMSGLVNDADFPTAYRIIDEADAAGIKLRLRKIYNRKSGKLTAKEKNMLKSRVTAISQLLDNTALGTVKEQLVEAAKVEAGRDATKVYLELAKIENYFGNSASAGSYINTAIYSSQDCADDSYTAAMAQIISVIDKDDKSNSENIKNVSEYVDNVLSHSLTVNVEAIVASDNKEEGSFSQTLADHVSKIRSAISIGKIDVTNFETIEARVQISSDYLTEADDIKNAIKVYDCGTQIKDFELEKIEYSCSNVLLLCDVSGSMSGSINDLKNAITAFVEQKNDKENISIVAFSSEIDATMPFGSSNYQLITFTENLSIGGGTNMFSALVSCLDTFLSKEDENNIIILMTDGCDNNPSSSEEIYDQIGKRALQKGVTIYTMGLGNSVDTLYLTDIADSGNGEFVYVSDSESLNKFYDMLHSQVYCQYKLTYKAQDTMTMSGRTLEVTLPDESLRDLKNYSLADDSEEGELDANADLSISGMSPRYLYKGMQDVKVKLKGTGFKKGSTISVKLNGNIDYTIEAKYVDDESYELTIPSGVAVGNYNVEVTIDGKKKILQNGFSIIVQGDEKKTEFGPYVFTSTEKISNVDGSITLRGCVTMNGWLHFKGDLIINGDLENDGSIYVTDSYGSYVEFQTGTAEGIAKFLAKKGISLDIPRLNNFRLYNDPAHLYDYSEYMVDDIATGLLSIYKVVRLDSLDIRLYPDRVGLYYNNAKAELPYIDKILKTKNEELFEVDFEGSAQITDKNIGIVIDYEYKDKENTYNTKVNLLNSPVYINGDVKVKIDTIKNEYTFGAMVTLAFFAKDTGFGAEISWKDDLIPDSVKLGVKLKKGLKLKTAVPIEANNFTFEVSDISTAVKDGSWTKLKFTGTADLSSCKASEYMPELKKFLGDVCLFEMPETKASLRVSPFTLEASAKLMFLGKIELAEAELKLGTFDYTNTLLGLDNIEVSGVLAKLKAGIMWESENGHVSVEISGSGELDAHSRFLGVVFEGTGKYDIDWWILNNSRSENGTIAVGLYVTHSGKKEFVLTYRTQDSNGKVKGKFYYIDEKGKTGKGNGVLQ